MTTATIDLHEHLKDLKASGRKGLIPFISMGDPDLETSGEILKSLSRAGAAAIEVGIPFSDPIADGPVIQASSQRALTAGASLKGILQLVEQVRPELDCPLVLFSYLNPLLALGQEQLSALAPQAGFSGILITDLLPGGLPDFEITLDQAGLSRILLVSPTTPRERVAELASKGKGFLYLIARRGVTGKGAAQDELALHAQQLKETTDLPLYAGFGVASRADVTRIWNQVDGAIVGSALVQHLHSITDKQARPQAAERFLRSLLED